MNSISISRMHVTIKWSYIYDIYVTGIASFFEEKTQLPYYIYKAIYSYPNYVFFICRDKVKIIFNVQSSS